MAALPTLLSAIATTRRSAPAAPTTPGTRRRRPFAARGNQTRSLRCCARRSPRVGAPEKLALLRAPGSRDASGLRSPSAWNLQWQAVFHEIHDGWIIEMTIAKAQLA